MAERKPDIEVLEELEELEELEPAEDDLDDLDRPIIDGAAVVSVDKSETFVTKAAAASGKASSLMAERFLKCDHSYARNRWGKDKCVKCSATKATEKQRDFAAKLIQGKFHGLMAKEMAELIDKLSVDEASELIDFLLKGGK